MKTLVSSHSRPEGRHFPAMPHIVPADTGTKSFADISNLVLNLKPTGSAAAQLVRCAVVSSAENVLAILMLLLALVVTTPNHGFGQSAATGASSSAERASVLDASYGKLPLSFEANQGQSDPQAKFQSRGNGYSLFLTDKEAVLALTKGDGTSKNHVRRGTLRTQPSTYAAMTDVIHMQLVGASNNLRITGNEQLPGTANYFIGNDPSKWHANVPTYAKVKYSGAYPGIDLVYYGSQRQLEYDFIVAPGVSPKPVRLHFAGAEKLRLDSDGDLTIMAKHGKIAFHKPVIYQVKDGQRQPIEGRFALLDRNTVGFALGQYDRSRGLVIDPRLVYSTYLGGSGGDAAVAIAVDSAGNTYIAGNTGSADFPVTGSAFQKHYRSSFVTKFNPSGSALVYSTYLGALNGGSSADGIAVDGERNVYLTGYTYASDFPVTAGAFQTWNKAAAKQASNAFVTKLNPEGSALVYSSYLGGHGLTFTLQSYTSTAGDGASAIALDSSNNAYITGSTYSTDFPLTANAFQKVNHAVANLAYNAFVAKFNSTGTALDYSTYVGGSGVNGDPGYQSGAGDSAYAIALDSQGEAYITGETQSPDFPTTSSAFQKVNKSGDTVFVTRLNAAGSALVYSTYLGGTGGDNGGDIAAGIAVDGQDNAYITGITYSADFPVTSGAFQTTNRAFNNLDSNAFVTKLASTGSTLEYSSYLGGSGLGVNNLSGLLYGDGAYGIAVDSAGDAYVTGSANSTDFPIAGNAHQVHNNGAANAATNAFITMFNPAGSTLLYSSYLGGHGFSYYDEYSDGDAANAIAVDASDNAYIAGYAYSTDFPVTGGAFQKVNNAAANQGTNAFVAKFALETLTTTTSPISNGNPQKEGVKVTFTGYVAPASGTVTPTGAVSFQSGLPPQLDWP